MTGELGVGFQDAVCGGVIPCCVHGIGAGLVERGREPHIAGVPAGDDDFWHSACDYSSSFCFCSEVCRQFVEMMVNWQLKLKNG